MDAAPEARARRVLFVRGIHAGSDIQLFVVTSVATVLVVRAALAATGVVRCGSVGCQVVLACASACRAVTTRVTPRTPRVTAIATRAVRASAPTSRRHWVGKEIRSVLPRAQKCCRVVHSMDGTGGRTWIRTRDLFLIREAL
jgi:hypothetical protein